MNGAFRWFLAAAGNQSAGSAAAVYKDAADYSHIAFDTVIQSGDSASDVYGVAIKPDGTKFYHVDGSEDLEEYNLSTAYDITSHGSRVAQVNLGTISSNRNTACTSIFFKPDGTKLFTTDVDDNFYIYSLSTAWDITTISYVGLFDMGNVLDLRGMYVSPDGTKFFGVDWRRDRVYRWSLSTAWDITTGTRDQASSLLDISSTISERIPRGFWMSDDGLKAYILGDYRNRITSFDLSTAWDITEIDGPSDSLLNIGSQETTPLSWCFSSDGRYIYVGGAAGNGVDQYDRGTV